jgi:sugar phosphate isomerase/epimerase
VVEEGSYRYMHLDDVQGEVLSFTNTGDALVVKHPFGAGEIYTVSAEYGIAQNPEYTTYEDGIIRDPWSWADTGRPLASPYKNIESVWGIIEELISSAQPLVIEGRDIEKIINVTEDPKVFYVLLSNQGSVESTVCIKPAKGTFKNIRNLFEEEDVDLLEEDKTYLHLPPLDVTILRVDCTEPCISMLPKAASVNVDRNTETPKAEMSLSDQLKLAAASGFTGMQVRLRDVRNLTDREIQNFKDEAQAQKVPITTLWAVSDMTPYLDVDINSQVSHDTQAVEEFCQMIVDTGAKCGVSRIAVSGGFGVEYAHAKSDSHVIIGRLKALAGIAGERGIEIVFVPHHNRKGKTGAEAAYFARKSGIKCALDMGHAAIYGDSIKGAVFAASDSLACVYLNSAVTTGQIPADAHRLPSAGEEACQSLGELTKTLETVGYAGTFCINPSRAFCAVEALLQERERLEREFGIAQVELCVL